MSTPAAPSVRDAVLAEVLQSIRAEARCAVRMLTSVSRSIVRWLSRESDGPPSHALLPAASAPIRPVLRLVEPGETHDHVVMPLPISAGAFVAGEGARLYSLDAFRRARPDGAPPTRAA